MTEEMIIDTLDGIFDGSDDEESGQLSCWCDWNRSL
jgi:hypothetical protein